MTTEAELLETLRQQERAYMEAQKKLAQAKKVWTEAETRVVETKLTVDRTREELRVLRNTTPNYTPTLRELEIEGFRERNPETVEYARERDEEKSQ